MISSKDCGNPSLHNSSWSISSYFKGSPKPIVCLIFVSNRGFLGKNTWGTISFILLSKKPNSRPNRFDRKASPKLIPLIRHTASITARSTRLTPNHQSKGGIASEVPHHFCAEYNSLQNANTSGALPIVFAVLQA